MQNSLTQNNFNFKDYSDGHTVTVISKLQYGEAGTSALKVQPERPKVASYCRVSSLSDPQEESLENQMIHYTNYIRSNPHWQFAGIYSDRGKTGTQIEKRTGFNKMVRDAIEGKIDTILCKSISRFARNVTDTLNTIRTLSNVGVNVVFEKEQLDTSSMQSEFILTMLSAVAQEESRSTSSNITWANSKRFEQGEGIFCRILGYKKEKNRAWIVVEEEAKIVREAFQLYLEGLGFRQIAQSFIGKGYKKANGKKEWTAIAIRDMLSNERYTGDVLCQKTYTKDHLSHESVKNNGERSQFLIKNNHEPIIDRKTFEAVQKRMANNKQNLKRGKKKSYPLSGRLVCGECGYNLHRYVCREVVTWRCGHQTISNQLCKMKGIKEERILKAMVKAFDQRYESAIGQGRRQIINLIKELQSAVSIRAAQQNQLRLTLERALLAENNAIFKSEDPKEFTEKRKEVENQIVIKESWWQLVDADDIYRKKALSRLAEIKEKTSPAKELQVTKNNIEFLRGWVVRIKAVSPFLFTISWINGDETTVEIEEGEET
ncbi:recombinase family protein [Alkalicella caledoniensis]|uniref:Recombinase family protein n=1 Tax=Alkalicella caledoniensis TaxID=2731377 RepID=A0A7G9W3Q9_ALKCA|nr:recombinase family protein [Alkalicella caledoniensis]QNO13321.1 recombinase family protein [Alkalicella caledoniensis]